jgi:predicted short-subunit dehydrogenase-like oxidoreductase (DUF2520 family)
MKVSILGAGNVATNLALALKKAGHTIVQIYNRSDDAGQELAHTVAASFTSDISKLQEADIYIIAVKDDAIEERAAQLKVADKIVAHTSGTRSMNLLESSSVNYGIFYPLQTMKKNTKVDFRNVPLLIEGSNEETALKLNDFARTISQNVHIVNEVQRQWIHVAAVFANNFTNHLFDLSQNILATHELSFDILKPLILSFVQNLQAHLPAEIQTGPAIRGDRQTIEQHMQLLANDPRLKEIYQMLTNSIITSAQNHS